MAAFFQNQCNIYAHICVLWLFIPIHFSVQQYSWTGVALKQPRFSNLVQPQISGERKG